MPASLAGGRGWDPGKDEAIAPSVITRKHTGHGRSNLGSKIASATLPADKSATLWDSARNDGGSYCVGISFVCCRAMTYENYCADYCARQSDKKDVKNV
ncbi:MAG: hypothetical protein A3G87_08545 [Omnitrophica bacterium RIFCSPLOWO2_12_FULL_50_11]|nr:MAG: hypothetical protein A3G87_08545 [Omnitrophica bacterium RIFCSPLOWO2_12_FULL_50_11]